MRLLVVSIYLLCFMMSYVYGELKTYCYDPPGLRCEEHILVCDEGKVISTDDTQFRISFLRNRNYPACETQNNECKNKTCCRYFNDKDTVQGITLTDADNTSLINFIKTECSFKSSCIVSYYNSSGGSDLYDFVTYNYGCISKDNITVDFLVNRSTKFTGHRFESLYNLDYTGNRSKDVVKLNRECIVTTTKGHIVLRIKELNLQAHDCCRFHITRYNVSEYCSQNGSLIPPNIRTVSKATIRLRNVVNKDGDSFSIIVKAAGNVTVDCRTIEHDDKQETSKCQYTTPQSSTLSSRPTSMPSTSSLASLPKTENMKMKSSDTNLTGIIGGTVGGLLVLLVIIIIIIVVMRRRKRRPTGKVDENNYTSTVDDDPKSNYTYIDVDLDKVGYSQLDTSAKQVKDSDGTNQNDEKKKHPIFKRQDFSFVEGKFDKNMESKNARKRSIPDVKADVERKVESEAENYTYIDDSFIKTPSALAAEDGEQVDAGKELSAPYKKNDKIQGKFIPSTNEKVTERNNYNHIALDEAPPKIEKQDPNDNYNHIRSNIKNENSLPKGNNPNPASNYYFEIEVPQEDDYADTYDHAEQGGKRILNQKKKKQQNSSDTYNHIGVNNGNSEYEEAKALQDTYNHIGENDFLAKGANVVSDTYNHIGDNKKNSPPKGADSESDTYNHIGVDNKNSPSKGAPLQLDTYNHIGVNYDNSAVKRANVVSDTYNHIEVNNDDSVKGANVVSDTYNHIGVNNDSSAVKGGYVVSDTYNHIGINNDNSAAKGANVVSDTYNHIGVNNDNSPKGAISQSDTYNHIGVQKNDPRTKGGNTSKPNQSSDNYNHISL